MVTTKKTVILIFFALCFVLSFYTYTMCITGDGSGFIESQLRIIQSIVVIAYLLWFFVTLESYDCKAIETREKVTINRKTIYKIY